MVVSQVCLMVGLSAWGLFTSYDCYKKRKVELKLLELKARQKKEFGVNVDLSMILDQCSGVCIKADLNAKLEEQASQIEEQKQQHFGRLIESLSTAIVQHTLQDLDELN